jgi:hypothetical protein
VNGWLIRVVPRVNYPMQILNSFMAPVMVNVIDLR